MKFRVWCPEHDETFYSAREIEACDAAEAAEEYASIREREQCSYSVASGISEMRVWVRDPNDSDREYVVTGEVVPYYRAELRHAPDL